jgi:hypothetical protein
MCMPDYIYGLILIDSLGNEAAPSAARLPDHIARRKSRSIWPPREKKFPTGPADADNVAAAGARRLTQIDPPLQQPIWSFT